MGANDQSLKKISKACWNAGKFAKKWSKRQIKVLLDKLQRKDD